MEDKYTIYRLTFPNNKVYIGQAVDYKNRMATHKYAAKIFKNNNLYIENAIRKYSWDNIKKEIIISNLSQNQVDFYEGFWIEIYNSTNKSFGYNIESGGKRQNPKRQKMVYQFDSNGILINEWKSTRQAARQLNISCSGISKCAIGKAHSAFGYYWSYNNNILIRPIINPFKLKVQSKNLITGEVIIFNGVREAGRYFNIDGSDISKSCKKNLSKNNIKFNYINE